MHMLFWLAIGLVGLLILRKVSQSFQVTEKDINKDLKQFREELLNQKSKLTPWSHDDLSLLSRNLMEHKKSRGRHSIERGIIKNIYQEPTLAYIIKQYGGKSPRTLLIITTNTFEMVWVRNESGITVYKNGQYVANILRDGRLFNRKGNRQLGFIKQDQNNTLSIYINDQLTAMISKEQNQGQFNPRAFELLKNAEQVDMDPILALGMLDLVEVLSSK
jgi:hypothetical protein